MFFCNPAKFDTADISALSFHCFKWLFIILNKSKDTIEIEESRFKYRKSETIEGLVTLISINFHTSDDSVHQEASKLIICLLTRYNSDSISLASEILNKFTTELLNSLLFNKDNETFVKRGLFLLKGLLKDEDEEISERNQTVHVRALNSKEFKPVIVNVNQTIRHLRREIAKAYNQPLEKTVLINGDKRYGPLDDDLELRPLKINCIIVDFSHYEAIDFCPLKVLSQNQNVIKTLFELLTYSNQTYADLA